LLMNVGISFVEIRVAWSDDCKYLNPLGVNEMDPLDPVDPKTKCLLNLTPRSRLRKAPLPFFGRDLQDSFIFGAEKSPRKSVCTSGFLYCFLGAIFQGSPLFLRRSLRGSDTLPL
jgi:hypothetical protein